MIESIAESARIDLVSVVRGLGGEVYICFPDGSKIRIRWPDGHVPDILDFSSASFRDDDIRGWGTMKEKG